MSQSTHVIYSGGTAPGGSTIPAALAALTAINSLHKGSSRPSYAIAGTLWLDDTSDPVWTLKLYTGSADISILTFNATNATVGSVPSFEELGSGDTTPSVASKADSYETNANGTITTFDNGVAGQVVNLVATDASTTIDAGLTLTGKTIPLAIGDTLSWRYDGSSWLQVGGSVGMGTTFVTLDPVVSVASGWIASSNNNTYTDVDVSAYLREGADRAEIMFYAVPSSGVVQLLGVRPNGSSDALGKYVSAANAQGDPVVEIFEIALDDDAVFEAKFGAPWLATTNAGYVTGYYI